ncbi:unnamed protein product, partial [Effrenium voratum]
VSNRDLFLRLADALTAKTAKMAPKHVLDLLAVYEAADLRPRALYVELLHAVLRLSRSMYAEELTLTLQALARYNLGNPTVVSQLMRTVRNEIKEFRLRYLCASAGALGALHACPQELLDVLDQRARFEVDTISVQELLDNIQAFPQLEFSWQPYEDLCLTEFLQRLSKFRTAEEVDQLVSPFEVARFLQSRGLLSPEFLRALCQWSLKGAHRPNVRAERRPSTRQLLQLQDLCFEHGLEEEPALQDAIQYFVESAGGKWHSIYAKPLKYKRRRAYIRREDPLDGLELPELPEPVSRPKQLERPEDLAGLPSSQETNALASFEDEGPRIKPSAPSPLLENEIFRRGEGGVPLAENATVLNPSIDSVNQLTGGKSGEVVSASATNPMAPSENLVDGNKCCDDEEKFEGLCYKKCSILTNGAYKTRVSAFQCSESSDFQDFFKSKTEGFPIPCTGFDIAGDECAKGCPHNEGACLVTEEMHLGKCYKKCSELTGKEYPVRTSADTCCKTKNLLECFSPANTKFSPDFNVGGGLSGKEADVHSPEVKLTEATR